MTHSTEQEEEVTMYKRTLKTLLVAAAFGVAIPLQAALAMPTDHTGGTVVVQTSTPLVSEKLAGLNLQVQAKQYAPIVSEKLAGLTQSTTQVSSRDVPIVSEKLAGLNLQTQQPVERVFVSSNTNFDWGAAGMGAGVVFGSLLVLLATAAVLRRRQTHFAH